jgi:hypothetical protein
VFLDHSIFSRSKIWHQKWGNFWAGSLFLRRKWALMLLVLIGCAANQPVNAAGWRCGTDAIITGDRQTLQANGPAGVSRDVHLKIEAVDAFSTSQHPGKSFRLADIAFVPGYEDAALAWLRKASLHKVSVTMRADHPDYLGRTPVDVDDPVVGNWRAKLLAAGLAMLVPETGQDIATLIGLEDGAITNRSGLWSDKKVHTAYYGIANRTGDDDVPTARDAIGRFAVIDGTIKSIEHQEWRSYLNFGSNWREDFTIALDADARDAFTQNGDVRGTFEDWIGQKVRVRGVIENRGGPYIALEDPLWLCLSPQ